MVELETAVDAVIHRCLAIRPDEDVLVIADAGTRAIGEALRDGAAGAGADAVLAIMDERATDGTDAPRPIAAAMSACEVFIAPTTRSLSRTPARKRASEAGARGATLPGVTEDMLARVMAADFELRAAPRAVAELLETADAARLTCPRGSDFQSTSRPPRRRRHRRSDRASSVRQPTAGEGFIAPLNGEGTVVASPWPLGLSGEPAS